MSAGSSRGARAKPEGGKHARIFAVIRRIPRGRVSSYGEVAALAGLAGHARLVGYALHASAPDSVPWHRVVNARGQLSLARIDPDGALTQRLRLEREGVRFDAGGRVRMARHRWAARRATSPRKRTQPISSGE